jgi:hypothetical protein
MSAKSENSRSHALALTIIHIFRMVSEICITAIYGRFHGKR